MSKIFVDDSGMTFEEPITNTARRATRSHLRESTVIAFGKITLQGYFNGAAHKIVTASDEEHVTGF